MKGLAAILLGMFLLSGCSFIIAEDQDISSFGMKKDEATSYTREIQRQRPENLPGSDYFPSPNLK